MPVPGNGSGSARTTGRESTDKPSEVLWPRILFPMEAQRDTILEKAAFVKQTSALLLGQVTKLGLQAAYFVILARMLGVQEFGLFSALLAIAAIVAPFSNLGASLVMAKAVARDKSAASAEWTRTLVYTLAGGTFTAGILVPLTPIVTPQGTSMMSLFLIVIAEVIGVKLVENAGYLWQSLGTTKALATLPTLINLFRLVAALLVFTTQTSVELSSWAFIYFIATMPLAIVVSWHTSMKIGLSRSRLRPNRSTTIDGLQYAMGLSSQSIHNDIDKTMLARMVSTSSAGVYSAAYRLVDMAYAPIRAVAAASFPHLNREGAGGIRGSLKIVRRLGLAVIVYAFIGAIALYACAPLAPILLGTEYAASILVVQGLAVLILLRAATFLAADTLTSSDNQGVRTICQISVAALNIVANIILLPVFGIWGAIATTIASEALLAIMLWLTIVIIVRKTDRAIARALNVRNS